MPFKFLKTNFNGDPNIGLYGFATDSWCWLGTPLRKKLASKIERTLNVKIKTATAAESELVGIFAAGNSFGILLPKITEKYEIRKLKALFSGLNFAVIRSKETALGNLVICNDRGCLISERLRRFKKQIADCLAVEVSTGTVAGLEIVGSCAAASNIGCLCHPAAAEAEMQKIEHLLGVRVDVGTVSYGSPFIKAGLLVNHNGIVTSENSTGPELGRLNEVFGRE
jgi:translation initiation factor 6